MFSRLSLYRYLVELCVSFRFLLGKMDFVVNLLHLLPGLFFHQVLLVLDLRHLKTRSVWRDSVRSSVADPDPSDQYVFGPPGSWSGSISQRYRSRSGSGSGSGSFYHQEKIVRKTGSGSVSQRYVSWSFYHQPKIVRKTLISTVLWLLFDFLSMKNDENVPSKRNKQIRIWMDPTHFTSGHGGYFFYRFWFIVS